MPFLSRQNIAPEVKAKHEAAYKTRLRTALLDPALGAAQREHILQQLAGVGKPKDYTVKGPPKPWAIRFGDTSPVQEGES